MGTGSAPTWLRQVSPLLLKTTLTTVHFYVLGEFSSNLWAIYTKWGAQQLLFSRFLVFLQFMSAISRKLWHYLATEMRTL